MADDIDGSATSGMTPSLEALLMRQHGIRYGDAKRLVLQSRQTLQMSRDTPWNPDLKRECDCQLQGHPEQYPTILTPEMVRTESFRRSQSERKMTTALPSVLGELSTDVKDGEGNEGAHEGTKILDSDQGISSRHSFDTWLDNGAKAGLETKVKTESNSSAKVTPKPEIRIITISEESGDFTDDTEEETDSQRDEEDDKPYEVVDSNISQSQLDSVKTETQEGLEHVLDGGEQTEFAVDGTALRCHAAAQQCCAAKEHERAPSYDHCDCAETTAEGTANVCSRDLDDSNSIATAEELEEDGVVLAPTSNEEYNADKEDKHRTVVDTVERTDEISVDTTAMLSVNTIPCIIYLKGGPPEVPDDESLYPCYNLPTPAEIQSDRKHGIVHSFRHRIGSRIGIFRQQKSDRLSDNDSEAHRQTLVDL